MSKTSKNNETAQLGIGGVSGSTWFKTEQIEIAVNANGARQRP